jgi:hypothetical protein
MLASPGRPRYVSVEAGLASFDDGFEKLSLLHSLGYRQFKIVNQASLSRVRCPDPPLEGDYVDFRFGDLSSGPFGEETPGRWLNSERTVARYRRIVLEQRFFGAHGSLYRTIFHRAYEHIVNERVGWYDTHAR